MKLKNLLKTITLSLLTVLFIFSCVSTDKSITPAEPEPVIVYPEYRWSLDDHGFDDTESAAGWIIVPEEFWNYSGPAELTLDIDTFGKAMLRLDVDYTNDSQKDWSEPKMRFFFTEPVEMRGLNQFSFDFYYNPYFATTGHFKSKVIAMNENRSIIDAGSNAISGKEEVGEYLKSTVTLRIRNVSDSMDSVILSIAGYLTDYKGPVFFDNLRWENSAAAPRPAGLASVQVWNPPVPRPPSPEASPNKKRLMNYLTDQYGKYIISGQMDASWTTNQYIDMITRVYTDTGKYPAIKGFDFLMLNDNNAPFLGGREQVLEAIEWWEGKNNGIPLLPGRPDIHGIVTFCWHWRAGVSEEFYTDRTNFRIPWQNNKLDTDSDNFKAIIQDLDRIAARLIVFKERDIPILWRPLHEAAGRWFWWGASGPFAFKALWEYMYDYFTYEKGLNNLIWVWNGEHADWFPDPATVDIVGRDLYSTTHSSQKLAFDNTLAMVPARNLMVALTENGKIPDPDECIKDGAMWSWFMTWNDRSGSSQGDTHGENFWTGEAINSQAHKMKVYHHPSVITLDKLPNLTVYRLD